jgi:hypothetical protein
VQRAWSAAPEARIDGHRPHLDVRASEHDRQETRRVIVQSSRA